MTTEPTIEHRLTRLEVKLETLEIEIRKDLQELREAHENSEDKLDKLLSYANKTQGGFRLLLLIGGALVGAVSLGRGALELLKGFISG